jgi:hypothetical protein
VYEFDEIMYGNDDEKASLEVSDHRPAAVIFRTDLPDDDTGTGCQRIVYEIPDVRIESVIAHPNKYQFITNLSPGAYRVIRYDMVSRKGNLIEKKYTTIPMAFLLKPGQITIFPRKLVINRRGNVQVLSLPGLYPNDIKRKLVEYSSFENFKLWKNKYNITVVSSFQEADKEENEKEPLRLQETPEGLAVKVISTKESEKA